MMRYITYNAFLTVATIKIIIIKCPRVNSEYTASFIFPLINVGTSSVFLLFGLGRSENSQCHLLQNISLPSFKFPGDSWTSALSRGSGDTLGYFM